MAIYRIYLRSFAPWRQFGEMSKARAVSVPVAEYRTPTVFDPGVSIRMAPLRYGGGFHGDGRGFSLDTTSPKVTARVNAALQVVLPTGVAGQFDSWCDPSHGPWMGVGFEETATGTPKAKFGVSKSGQAVNAFIEYGAANPLVAGAPDIDAKGEFQLMLEADALRIVSTITGDQFPACEAFIEDPRGNKVFLGGFAPPTKEKLMRLIGYMNTQDVWFESEVAIALDPAGAFLTVSGGGSGSNVTGPACENLTMSVTQWNARIMGSIPMPSDAP